MKLPFDANYMREGAAIGIRINAITREGHRVRLTNLEKDGVYTLEGYDIDSKNPLHSLTWMEDGSYFQGRPEHPRDLLYMDIC